MSTITDVSGTAFVVAEYRAEENLEPAPIYQDRVVGLFLSDASRQAAERVSSRFPPVKDMVKTRTRYFDDMLDAQIAAGIRQVVILGAGLDTRAVRKPSSDVRYFEIDDPATMELKRRCYANARIDADVTLIPGNYVTDGLIDLLRSNGFTCDAPTYLIWEGNVMYMSLAEDKQTMLELTQREAVPAVVRLPHRVGGHEDDGRCRPHDSRRELRSDARALAVRYRRYP